MIETNSKTWLFSFADLAFLLLIAFTQASTVGKTPVNLGEMKVPKIVASENSTAPRETSYQVRIHGNLSGHDTGRPFELVELSYGKEVSSNKDLTVNTLDDKLNLLFSNGAPRPALLPGESSLTGDMLMAMSLVESIWEKSNVLAKRDAISNKG